MQKRNRSKRGRQLLARLDYLGCPGRNGGERERGMQPLSELLTSRHSGALQVHSLNSFSSPSYSSTLPSLSSPRSLAAFPLPSRASRPRPTTRLLLPKKISPRFRPTFSGGGRGRGSQKFDCPLTNVNVSPKRNRILDCTCVSVMERSERGGI